MSGRGAGVGWWTVMSAVIEHGTPPVEDPRRIGSRPLHWAGAR